MARLPPGPTTIGAPSWTQNQPPVPEAAVQPDPYAGVDWSQVDFAPGSIDISGTAPVPQAQGGQMTTPLPGQQLPGAVQPNLTGNPPGTPRVTGPPTTARTTDQPGAVPLPGQQLPPGVPGWGDPAAIAPNLTGQPAPAGGGAGTGWPGPVMGGPGGYGGSLGGDLDLTMPGIMEDWWAQNQGAFNPGQNPYLGGIQSEIGNIGQGYDYANQMGRDATNTLMGPGMGQQAVQTAMPGFQAGAAGGRMGGMADNWQQPNIPGASMSQGYAQGAMPMLQGQMQGGLSGEAYQNLQQSRPDLAADPGLNAYYDNQRRRAEEQIASTQASRGAFASSATGDMTTEMNTNLAAEQANREADYNLRRVAEQRQWDSLIAGLAGQTDRTALAGAQTGGALTSSADAADRGLLTEARGWQGLEADVAGSADRFGLDSATRGAEMGLRAEAEGRAGTTAGADIASREGDRGRQKSKDVIDSLLGTMGGEAGLVSAGGGFAATADQARRGRIGDLSDDTYRGVKMAQDFVSLEYDQMSRDDQQILDDITTKLLGEGKAFKDMSDQESSDWWSFVRSVPGVAKEVKELFSGGDDAA